MEAVDKLLIAIVRKNIEERFDCYTPGVCSVHSIILYWLRGKTPDEPKLSVISLFPCLEKS
jgi:hypothetical protein